MTEKRSNLEFTIQKKWLRKQKRFYPVVVFSVFGTALAVLAIVVSARGFSIAHFQRSQQVAPQVLGAYSDNPNAAAESHDAAPIDQPTLNPLIADPAPSAQSALVFELGGPVLYSKNPDAQVPIASLTKMMTALIVMQDPRHTQPITITAADHVDTSPVLHLRTGDSVYPDDLVHAMLVGSANDAALTLANHFAIPELTFIQRMNVEAQSLGMTQTMFSTPIGFDDPQNYSTARDLRKLISAALVTLPFAQTDQADSYTFHSASLNGGSYSIEATSHLAASDPTIHVLKTGFTDDAKQAMVASSEIQGRTVISIVLQSDNRDADSAALLHYVARAYLWPSK